MKYPFISQLDPISRRSAQERKLAIKEAAKIWFENRCSFRELGRIFGVGHHSIRKWQQTEWWRETIDILEIDRKAKKKALEQLYMNHYAQEYESEYREWKERKKKAAKVQDGLNYETLGSLKQVKSLILSPEKLMSMTPEEIAIATKSIESLSRTAVNLDKMANESWESVFGLLEVLREIHEAKNQFPPESGFDQLPQSSLESESEQTNTEPLE